MAYLSDDQQSLAEITVGLALGGDGNLEQALSMFDRAVEAAPDDPRPHAHRGTCLAKLGRLEEAATEFEASLDALRGIEGELQRRRGNVLTRLGRHADAQELLRRAVELLPASADAWYDLGVSLSELRMLPDAAEAFARAAALDGEGVDACLNLAAALAAAGRYEGAARALRDAVAREPSDVDVLFELGVCLGHLERYEEALAIYDRALALDPEDPDVWNNRGVALHELGRADEALDAYSRALALNPGLDEAMANRELLSQMRARGQRVPVNGASKLDAVGHTAS